MSSLPAENTSFSNDRERALELLKRYGWNATSFQSLEPGISYWFDSTGAACIAYLDTGAAWVVAGAPIAPPERFAELVEQLIAAAGEAGRRVCFFATEQRFAGAVPLCSVPIGEQPIWDPSEWPEALRGSRSLREQLRRGRAKGVSVRQVSPEELAEPDPPVRRAVEVLIEGWLAHRAMAPMGFLVQVYPFDFAAERRILVAELGGEVVGFLAMVPVYARNGWLLEDLVRTAASPNGTAELLIDGAMRLAAAGGSRYVTLGLAPLSGRVGWRLRLARALGSPLYSFAGIRAFKARLRPGHWEPIYLSYPAGQSRTLTFYDVLAAFAPGGLLRFGMETLLRRPELPVRLLALLLIPWTLLLATAETARWFPALWVQAGWVVFDAGLLAGLFALGARWRPSLATVLASLISADALLTLLQVVVYNLPRVRGPLDWLVLAVALAGPTLAALFLWSVLGRSGSARYDV
ncbi:MAG: phosphatidylglycerol lysyltransferase domain-containing protein [Armatimonadota bacterium]